MAGWLSSAGKLVGEAVVNFFFPLRCVGCSQYGVLLCGSCINALPQLAPPVCSRCGKPQTGGEYCPSCRTMPLSIDGIRSPFRFEGNIRKVVHDLKYHNLKAASSLMANLLYSYLQTNPLPADLLVAVPLHSKRLRERGYNQSYLVARELGKLMQLPVINDGLTRIRDTKPQVRTSSIEGRRRNVENAFACDITIFSGKRLILIDDVCTTGATLEACSRVLRSSGALSIWGLTIARET